MTVEAVPEFAGRHIGPSPTDIADMLRLLGVGSLDELAMQIVPADIRQSTPLELGAPLTEPEVLARARKIAASNRVMTSMIGQGYHDTVTPAVIHRNIIEGPAWYTAYTPYQPEISQGRLEALLNFQTMIADLTGLPIANASLLDEATAAAEAMGMARRMSKSKSNIFFVDEACHPQTIAVLRTRAEPLGWSVAVGSVDRDLVLDLAFGVLVQYPDTTGAVRNHAPLFASLRASDVVPVMAADPLALVLLKPPGELGAEIAIGSTQRFGVPLGFGGPHAAYIATKASHQRMLPGRLVGVTIDRAGRPAIRLALQTREQHIRREKATSNICTAQVLLAIVASMYGVYHGPDGLRRIARTVSERAATLARGLTVQGRKLVCANVFDSVCVLADKDRDAVIDRAREKGINLRSLDWHGVPCIGISCDETTTEECIEQVWRCFVGVGKATYAKHRSEAVLPAALARRSHFMSHPTFNLYHSETEMLRYIRRLSDKDLALDRSMIPLGSCTMKLNATTEMIPFTWPEFARIHPFAPADQAQGYRELVDELERDLCAITGYDAFSFQPNSGAQGEYAGLLAIRGYHRAKGQAQRKVCLIPTSAHGTNPASAQMAGMTVVPVACDDNGNIDPADLKAKVDRHSETLAAIMITYPSTHGVFEPGIRGICDLVHRHGGQVYLDGANLNAQVGLARPGDYGADVSHLNLHKTFCIPHGGGGPGMGPIGVKAHLTPHLPGDPILGNGAVSAAAYGSASILTISWIYVRLMGGAGLTRATQVAILNANYIARRLASFYPLLFKDERGWVAHECIIDTRPFKASAGISVDDIAKRLIDHGFHAPTMSFPVAGTLMIEPTESESKAELDRFCEAMISIRSEIDQVVAGTYSQTDNPLVNAPHTIFELTADAWPHAYTRKVAAYPTESQSRGKYWSPVARVDNVYGDRNLVCSCPPMKEYGVAAE
jgi:glycine dehydrogenase